MGFTSCARPQNAQTDVSKAHTALIQWCRRDVYVRTAVAPSVDPGRAPEMSGRVDLGSADMARAFGTVLRAARARQGISQERLAYCSGLDRTYPSLLERGVRQPTIGTLMQLSQVLRIAPVRLLEETLACYGAAEVASETAGTLRGICHRVAHALARCADEEIAKDELVGARLLDELAAHGLTIVAFNLEARRK
jgi:transcriptional regulator with XRE-family HTH domain